MTCYLVGAIKLGINANIKSVMTLLEMFYLCTITVFLLQDLIEDVKGDLSGHFLDTIKALLMAPAEYDAYQLRKAMKGLGTDEDVLIEVICTRSNAQLKEVIRTYKESKEILSEKFSHSD